MNRLSIIEFRDLREFERGILYNLLVESYSELLKEKSDYIRQYETAWKKEDDDAFNNPDTVGRCVSISILNTEPGGFFFWDPRRISKVGIINQNCIIPSHRDKGFGKLQIREIIRIFKAPTEILEVTIENHPFYYPARLIYFSSEFKESGRSFTEAFGRVELIHFRL